MVESASVWQALSNLILWLLIYKVYAPARSVSYKFSIDRRWLGHLLILTFCLFPFFGGDYFHYKDDFYEFQRGAYISLEPFYQWILRNTSLGSYTIFRLNIWGIALILLACTYRNLGYSRHLVWFIFGICYLPMFSYARVSLSISLILFGISYIVIHKDNKHILYLIVGLMCIASSEFFHRTAVIGIVAAIASFFLISAGRKTIICFLLLIPFATIILGSILNYISSLDLGLDMFISSKHISEYLDADQQNILGDGWGERIGIIFTRFPLFISILLYLKLVFNGKYLLLTTLERAFASYSFIIITIALLFLVDLGFNTYTLHYRTLNFAMPAIAVFLAAVWRQGFHRRLLKFIVTTSSIGAVYTLIYSIYCAL